MSIANILVQQVYEADGVTTSFPLPFAFLEDSAEDVTKVYLVDTTTGVKTLQAIGALNDYTLPHDVDSQPTAAVFNAAPDDDQDVLVTRLLDLEQAIEFISSGQNLLNNIEQAADIMTMLIQQVNEVAQKSVRMHQIVSLQEFDPVLPPTIDDVDSADRVIAINSTNDGLQLGPTVGQIEEASDFADAAAASASAASSSASSAASSAASAADSAAEAAVSAAAAALSGFVDTDFAITDGQAATNLTGETFDGTLYKAIRYFYCIVRGTTVVATGDFSLHYKNGTWSQEEGNYRGDDHGVTFTISQATTIAQLLAAADVGAGNGNVYLKKTAFAA